MVDGFVYISIYKELVPVIIGQNNEDRLNTKNSVSTPRQLNYLLAIK